MKVIDKTPFQDESGSISVVGRAQGTLKYGPNWYPEIQAQSEVISQLERLLDKGFVLIRNFALPDSGILIPMILLGPGSTAVMLASPVKGHFAAQGDEWNQIVNGVSVPARRNLMDLILKLTRVFEKYAERNRIQLPVQPEPILIITNPGAVVDTAMRPALKVVRSDGIKALALGFNQAGTVMRAEQIAFLAEQIVDPKLIPGNEEDDAASQPVSAPPSAQKSRKQGGLTRSQLLILAALGIFECCILGVGAYVLFFLT